MRIKPVKSFSAFILGTMIAGMTVLPALACNCNQGILQSAQAASGGDLGMTASLLRFAQLESGFGCAAGMSQPQNNGAYTYNNQAAGSSAFGLTQFTSGTWADTVRQQRSYIIQRTQAALNSTSDPILRRQYQQFLAYMNGTSGTPGTWRYYAGMNGPSMIMASALARSNSGVINPTAGLISRTVPGVDAYAVSAYISHNIGSGQAGNIQRALQSGRLDTPVDQIINQTSIRQNPSIWCQQPRTGSTCVPLTLRQAIARISDGGVGGQCVRQAFSQAGIPITTVGGPYSAYPVQPAVSATPDQGMQILNSATLAGQEAREGCYLSSGSSRYSVLCDPATAQGGSGSPSTTGGAGGNSTAATAATGAPGRTATPASTSPSGAPTTAGIPATTASRPTNNTAVLNNLSRAGGTTALDEIRACNANAMCEVGVLNKYQVSPTAPAAPASVAQQSSVTATRQALTAASQAVSTAQNAVNQARATLGNTTLSASERVAAEARLTNAQKNLAKAVSVQEMAEKNHNKAAYGQ